MQPLIKACSGLLTANPSDEITIICRRIIGALFNGGVALQLLFELQTKVKAIDYKYLKLPNFQAFDPQFISAVSQEEVNLVQKWLEIPISNFKKYVYKNASEAQFRVMFWDSVLGNLFYHHIDKNPESTPIINCFLQAEWNSKKLFKELDERKVDFAALWSDIPMFITEMGNGSFGFGVYSHKDFAKSIGLLSHGCGKLALKLEAEGKRAEDAKVFGMWIGGTQIQFVTGQAVVSKTDTGDFVIHCNCHFPPEWKLDVLSESVAETTESMSTTKLNESMDAMPIAELTETTELMPAAKLIERIESNLPASTTFSDTETASSDTQNSPSRIPSTPERLNLDAIPTTPGFATEPLSGSILEHEEISDFGPDVISLSEDEPDAPEPEVPEPEEGGSRVEFIAEVDVTTLVMINRFVGEFVEYIKSIPGLNSNDPPRKFKAPEQFGFIPESRRNAQGITPLKERLEGGGKRTTPTSLLASLKKARKADMDHYDSFYVCEDRGADEVKLYRKFLGGCSEIFPKLVEYFNSEDDEELFHLVIEKMDPLICRRGEATVLSEHLWYQNSAEALFKTVKFAIELLNGLDLLHAVFGYVHSDISPNNVMFSAGSGIWKLIDFGDSMEINLSVSVSRVAGTSEYISPESLETGIFTEASDVFALGRVIVDVLYYKLADKFESRSRRGDSLYKLFCIFEKLLFKMLKPDHKERIGVRDALLGFYGILRKFPSELFNPDQAAYLRVGALYEESVESESKKQLEKKMEQAVISEESEKPFKKIRQEFEKPFKKIRQEFEEIIVKSSPLLPGEFS